jgi:transcriptional regulator with XRE-family HTH domain
MAYVKYEDILVYVETKTASMIFADNIRRIRQQKGLSQYDVADKSGISRRMISHYEREGILPPMDRLEALANALGVKISSLFEDTSTIPGSENLVGIDPRSVKKLKDILSLPSEDRNDLYRILNKMLKKNQLEAQKKSTG